MLTEPQFDTIEHQVRVAFNAIGFNLTPEQEKIVAGKYTDPAAFANDVVNNVMGAVESFFNDLFHEPEPPVSSEE